MAECIMTSPDIGLVVSMIVTVNVSDKNLKM